MSIHPSIKEAWEVNEAMNQILLDYLTPDMLNVQTPNKDWSVAGYLAHLVMSKKWWGTHFSEAANTLPNLYQEVSGKTVLEKDLSKIKDAFKHTSKLLLEEADKAIDKGKLPYSSLDVFLIQKMIHDGHHRGQIMLILRNAGYTPPNDDDFWGGWWPDQDL